MLVESVVLFCWWYGCLSVVVGGGANIGLVVLMSSYPEECLFRQDIHLIRPGGSLSLSQSLQDITWVKLSKVLISPPAASVAPPRSGYS